MLALGVIEEVTEEERDNFEAEIESLKSVIKKQKSALKSSISAEKVKEFETMCLAEVKQR